MKRLIYLVSVTLALFVLSACHSSKVSVTTQTEETHVKDTKEYYSYSDFLASMETIHKQRVVYDSIYQVITITTYDTVCLPSGEQAIKEKVQIANSHVSHKAEQEDTTDTLTITQQQTDVICVRDSIHVEEDVAVAVQVKRNNFVPFFLILALIALLSGCIKFFRWK